jgi:hypothetical protein
MLPDGRTDGLSDGQTVGRTSRRTVGPTVGRTVGQTAVRWTVGPDGSTVRRQSDGKVRWTRGRSDGRLDGRLDGWTDIQSIGWSVCRTNSRTGGRMDGRTDGQAVGRLDASAYTLAEACAAQLRNRAELPNLIVNAHGRQVQTEKIRPQQLISHCTGHDRKIRLGNNLKQNRTTPRNRYNSGSQGTDIADKIVT